MAVSIFIEESIKNELSCLEYWKMQTFSSGADLTEVREGGTKLHPQDSQTKFSDNFFLWMVQNI